MVRAVVERDRKSAAETSGPGNRPATGQLAAPPEDPVERDVVVVADDKVVAHVERGWRFRSLNVKRVHLFADVRRDVDRLAQRIACRNAGTLLCVSKIE